YQYTGEYMDDIVINGYSRLIELIQTTDTVIDQNAAVLQEREAELLGRMGTMTGPVIKDAGITILEKGKKDNQGGIYDAVHYDARVFILGKSIDLVPYRPDNMSRTVNDQFCLLCEDGKFYEVMYSTDDLIVDSYMGELTPRQVLDIYGYEAVYMLYKGMKEYLEGQETLLSGLESTLQFLSTGATK
ncbi:MAG: hypothetical protein V1862_03075, partial [Methanobacteriota archaeon]